MAICYCVSERTQKPLRDNNVIRKAAAYIVLGVNSDGRKEVLSVTVGESKSSKFWLTVLNELKNRGVKDVGSTAAEASIRAI